MVKETNNKVKRTRFWIENFIHLAITEKERKQFLAFVNKMKTDKDFREAFCSLK